MGDEIATLRARAQEAESRALISKDPMAKAGWEAIATPCRSIACRRERLPTPTGRTGPGTLIENTLLVGANVNFGANSLYDNDHNGA